MHRKLARLGLALCVGLTGCGTRSAPGKQKTAPAKITHRSESDIDQIVLTPRAEERLQITTFAVEKRAVRRTRTVGGQITIPDGAQILVTAPLTGTLVKPSGLQTPVAGQEIQSGQVVFHLLPLLSPIREVPTAAERVVMANARASLESARIVALGDIMQGLARVQGARLALDRAKQLVADKAGSERDRDAAQALFEIAVKTLETARQRLQLLEKLTLEAKAAPVTTVVLQAPQNGILRAVSSSIGQTVSAGAALFEVVNLKTVWVRVPVYPGLRKQVAGNRNALVRDLGGPSEDLPVRAVKAPPSADPLGVTVDLFYELPNPSGRFHPGERVEVTLPLSGETESLVVPRGAILRDIHGVAWVYVNLAPQTFQRHRVEVHFTTASHAVLSRGPAAATPVVVDGAAELFGTEFGAGK